MRVQRKSADKRQRFRSLSDALSICPTGNSIKAQETVGQDAILSDKNIL
ncbi:MAG: hypothetical protein ABSE41_17090 [Bacteroidota bacterium]|jgi:hypothetical protein